MQNNCQTHSPTGQMCMYHIFEVSATVEESGTRAIIGRTDCSKIPCCSFHAGISFLILYWKKYFENFVLLIF
jgi:hypothetical protein